MGALIYPEWRDARDRALAVLAAGCRWVAVLGLPGTGKTILLNEIGRALVRSSGKPLANIAEPGVPPMLIAQAGPSGTMLLDDADRLDDATLAGFAAA